MNKPKLLSYSFLVALHASSAPFAAASQFYAKSTQYCHLETLFPGLYSQLSGVLQSSNSSEEVRNAINSYYSAARDVDNSVKDIEIIEEIADLLSQFYKAFKVKKSPEFKLANCSSLSSSGAFLAEVDSRYESYLSAFKEKSLQADVHLSAAQKEKNAIKKIYSEKFKDERQALQYVSPSGSDDASFVSELKIPPALEPYSPEIDVFPGKDVDQQAAAAQRQQQEQLLAAAAEQEEVAVLQQEQGRIKGLAAEQEAAAAERQQAEQLLARKPAVQIQKKLLNEKDRLQALESQMRFQELLDQKEFNIAGINSNSQLQDGAYDIEGLSTAPPVAQSEDELELLKQIDSLKQKQQQLISERIKILEMRMKLEGYDPESYSSPPPQPSVSSSPPGKPAATQRIISKPFSTAKISSASNPYASQTNSSASLLASAKNYLLDGQASQALALLKPSATIENNNPEYHFLVGRAYQELKLNTESLESYSLAIHLDPRNHKYWINRGLIKGALKDPKGSLKDLSESLSLKKTAMGYLNRGVTFAAMNKPQEAIEDLTNAIRIKPNYSQAYRNRGIILKHRGDLYSACSDWKKAHDFGDKDMKSWLSSYCSDTTFKF